MTKSLKRWLSFKIYFFFFFLNELNKGSFCIFSIVKNNYLKSEIKWINPTKTIFTTPFTFFRPDLTSQNIIV